MLNINFFIMMQVIEISHEFLDLSLIKDVNFYKKLNL